MMKYMYVRSVIKLGNSVIAKFVVLAVGVSAVLGAGAIAAPIAYACDIAPPYAITVEDLAVGEGPDLLAHLQADYVQWGQLEYGDSLPEYVDAQLPVLIGVWYERAVIAVDPAEGIKAGSGGVTVVDAIWGHGDGAQGPFANPVDLTDCAGTFPFPEPGEFHLITDREFNIELRQPGSAAEIEAVRAFFDANLGAPVRPVRDAAEESAALDEVLRGAARDEVDVAEPRFLDPQGGDEIAEVDDDSILWPIAGIAVAVSALGAVVVMLIRVRR